MNLDEGYIELIHETGWKHPIQAYMRRRIRGKISSYHYFAEWNSFEEAIKWLRHAHKEEIIINPQQKIGL